MHSIKTVLRLTYLFLLAATTDKKILTKTCSSSRYTCALGSSRLA